MSVLSRLIKGTVLLSAALVLARHESRRDHPGNDSKYDPQSLEMLQTPLNGKHMVWLGSSFSAGTGSAGIGLPDYLEHIDQLKMINESIAHSYLASVTQNSAVKRFRSNLALIDDTDYFVLEISPIDCEIKAGTISDSFDRFTFDIKTTIGALEYLISYAKELWHSEIILFTLPYCSDPSYEKLINIAKTVSEKWQIHLIDMYHDNSLENPDPVKRSLYMADNTHPSKAGYRDWITPYMQKQLTDIAAGGKCE